MIRVCLNNKCKLIFKILEFLMNNEVLYEESEFIIRVSKICPRLEVIDQKLVKIGSSPFGELISLQENYKKCYKKFQILNNHRLTIPPKKCHIQNKLQFCLFSKRLISRFF